MTTLSAAPITDTSVNLFGKDCDDLQENIEVNGNTISGTLKYIDDYSSAFGPGLDSGNYLAMHFEVPEVSGVTITVKVTDPVTLEADGDVVLRIADKDTQTITVTATKGANSYTRIFTLTDLVCNDSVG